MRIFNDTLRWPAPAKLNLFLYITGQRPDGYHLLQTFFQLLDYSDKLIIMPRFDGIINCITSANINILEQENLILRAAYLLQSYYWSKNDPTKLGADIKLEKILPIGGGLGGGSSNAATVLLVLNKLWNCHLSINKLAQLGLSLGADIPFFIYGRTSFAEGVGEILKPIELSRKWYLVIVPSVSIDTHYIFCDPQLRINSQIRSIIQLLMPPFYNDCEPTVRKLFPEVEQNILWLLKYKPARLTGTGACIFAEFDTEIEAKYVLSKVPTWVSSFVAKGINVSPLHCMLSKII